VYCGSTTVFPVGRRPSYSRHHPCSLGPLTFMSSKGQEVLRAGCWTYRTAFTSESSRSHGVKRKTSCG